MLTALILLASASIPSDHAPVGRFPFQPFAEHPGRIELAPDFEQIAALRDLDRVRLSELHLPDATALEVTLDRVELPVQPEALYIDGRATGVDLSADISLWSGQVAGRPGSSVFLALSVHGSWGWIQQNGKLFHLLTMFNRDGISTHSAWMTDELARERFAWQPLACGAEAEASPVRRDDAPRTGAAHSSRPVLRVRLALETDWQFYQLFNNELATATYTLAVLGAANSRYREQVDAVMTLEYLGIYTHPGDPWTQPDVGGDCFAYLAEFQAAWGGGGAPVAADLYHIFTAANTQCGLASGHLCDAGAAWSLTGKMDGLTPFPVAPGPLNWDFVWFCHETGHNFGSPHTHSFCPPLDECAPSGWFGTCQTQQVCITNGTFMSYCHACPGGLANFTTWFHPVVADVMRATVESGCLSLFEGVLTADLGEALLGSNGHPELTVGYDSGSDSLLFVLEAAPFSQAGAWISSTVTVYQPWLGGGILVPDLTLLIPFTTNTLGTAAIAIPVHMPFPGGVTAFTQAWIRDPSGPNRFAASNAVEWELIRP